MTAPLRSRPPFAVGVISDTHGLLRPSALDALRGSDAIIHAGDIGRPEILDALRALAPLTVVRGNIDRQPWCESIPPSATLCLGGRRLHVVHDIADLNGTGMDAVIFGHSHKPVLRQERGVLLLNPGSAGPRRFSLPISLARLRIDGDDMAAELVTLPS